MKRAKGGCLSFALGRQEKHEKTGLCLSYYEQNQLFRVFGAMLRISQRFKRESSPIHEEEIVSCEKILMKTRGLPGRLSEHRL